VNARLTKSEIKATVALLKEHEAAVLTQSSIVCQDGVDDKYADGRVSAIAPMTDGACYIFLEDPQPNAPDRDRFRLPADHPNYNAIFSLALACAVNGLELRIRTTEAISSTKTATVCYAWGRDF
jgi:hypothetical protein